MNSPANSTTRTLVIGGAGYIGGHIVPKLIHTGRQVTVLGRHTTPKHKLPASVDYIKADFAKLELLKPLLDTHSEIIHLAYATVPNTSFSNPLADLLQNLPPTIQLFSEIADRDATLVLVSSGGTTYGENKRLPIREDHQTKPISPYGLTKLTLENYAYLYAATHGLKYICVRPANAFGEGQLPFVGQGFISTAIASALRGEPVTIFGKEGTVRDYIHVSDLASGIVSALQKGELSEIYNIGSGIGRSNLDVVKSISLLMEDINCPVTLRHLPERTFDVKTNILDSTKLYNHTGWKPRVSFGEGLRLTLAWLQGGYE